jgi:hypothetical protein
VKIRVQAGDFVGVYYPGVGSVAYTLDPPGLFNFGFGNLTGTVLSTNNNTWIGNETNFITSSNRHYSIRAMRDRRDDD